MAIISVSKTVRSQSTPSLEYTVDLRLTEDRVGRNGTDGTVAVTKRRLDGKLALLADGHAEKALVPA